MSGKRTLVFANGVLSDLVWAQGLVQSSDVLIAADGGLKHALALGLVPEFLVGDLDSVTPEQVEEVRAKGCRVEQYPREKDQTDLELALLLAVNEQAEEILVLGALGGRIDHELANLSLLLLPELIDIKTTIISSDEEIFLINAESEINGQKGDRVSLIPWGGPAIGVSTRGLFYPLEFETLTPDRSRGVSNVMLGEHAVVTVESGSLLCIYSHTTNQLHEEGKTNEI